MREKPHLALFALVVEFPDIFLENLVDLHFLRVGEQLDVLEVFHHHFGLLVILEEQLEI